MIVFLFFSLAFLHWSRGYKPWLFLGVLKHNKGIKPGTEPIHHLCYQNGTQAQYIQFYPSGRYLWMKVAGWILRSRPLLALSAMFSLSPLPWFVYSNLLQNASIPINPTHLTWHCYFMHIVRADIPTSHAS